MLTAQTRAQAAKGWVAAPGPINAGAYILMDVDSGRILAQHNAGQRMFPASTTKTMTALVAIAGGDLERKVRIGVDPSRTGEASIFLMPGENLPLADLVRAALIRSANDSCVAIAEAVAGSVPAFVKLMNQKAREVGATHTHFANPHGLHDPNHYTTAHDLALIARAALRDPFFNQTIRTREAIMPGNWKIGPQRLLVNRNRLLFRWNACDGVKTGYTKQAGNCLIASATRLDPSTGRRWRLLSVVLHSTDTSSDSVKLLQGEGFTKFHPLDVARAGEPCGKVEVPGGANSVEAVTPRDVRLPLRSDEVAFLTRRLRLFGRRAPVAKGQIIGYLEFSTSGHKLMDVPLVAQSAVGVSLAARAFPAAASIIPSNPALRWGLGGLLLLSLALSLAALKARANGVRGRRARPTSAAPARNSRPAASPIVPSAASARSAQPNSVQSRPEPPAASSSANVASNRKAS